MQSKGKQFSNHFINRPNLLLSRNGIGCFVTQETLANLGRGMLFKPGGTRYQVKGVAMASKLMKVREDQKAHWELKLKQRLDVLKGNGTSDSRIDKDTVVRKIKAKIKETASRIRAIIAKDEKIKEMARVKEEKKAAP